jgi:chemotaxis protein CheD
LGFGGLCHFDQPWGKGKDLNTRHANGAILSLARRLKDMGARRQQLDAQIIGGACRLHSNFCHADQCVKMAKRILKKFNIPIVSTDTGGRFGRKVIFNPKSGEVAVVKTQKLRASDWNCLGS